MDREAVILFSTDLWTNPAFVGLVIALPATVIGYLGYRRSRNLDRVAEQAGIATTNVTSIGQVVDGLNKVITAVQSDNDDLRKEVRELRATVEEIHARLEAGRTLIAELRERISELENR